MTFRNFCWFLFTGILLLCISCNAPVSQNPKVKKGVLDLRNRDFQKEGNVNLDGDWEFYWKQLFNPEELKNKSRQPDYLQVPGVWTQYNKDKSEWETGDGYGTYRLTILVKTKELKLYVPTVSTAMELWADDELVCKIGQVGTSEKTSKPSYHPQTIFLHPKSDTIHLLLKVSNFHYRKGGLGILFY